MNSRSLSAYFCYNDYRDLNADTAPCVRASDNADWSKFAELTPHNEDDLGSVIIRAGDTEIRVEDSLIATVSNHCLGAIPDLVDKRHVVVRLFMSYGYVRMDPEASDQLVTGDHISAVRFKRAQLIPALVGVGRNYLEFLEACRKGDPKFAATIGDVREGLKTAQTAFARWDGN
jgi:hypothetical protein